MTWGSVGRLNIIRERKECLYPNLLKKKNMKLTVAIKLVRICVIPKAGNPIKKTAQYRITGQTNAEG